MTMRIASISKEQYDICMEYGLWGDERGLLRKWSIGDYLLFKVGNEILSIVKISGEAYEDDLLIWSNGYYPHRIKFEVVKEFTGREESVFIKFKEMMLKEYGTCYGWVIQNKTPLKDDIANILFSA